MAGDRYSGLIPNDNIYVIKTAADLPQELDQWRIYHLLYDPGAGIGLYYSPDNVTLVPITGGGGVLPVGLVEGSLLRWSVGSVAWLEFSAFVLPATDGTLDQIMQTDGAGTVTWIDIPAGVAPGTILHSTLRWDGVNWVESDRILNDPAADITMQSNAVTGFININSPVVFGPYTHVPGAAYAFDYSPVADNPPGAFVGGGLNMSGNILTAAGTFIYESFRGAPTITTGVAPGFAAYTVLQALPKFNAGAGAGLNPLAPLVLNAAPIVANAFAGTKTVTTLAIVNGSPQVQAALSGAVMVVNNTTGFTWAPKFSTVAGSTANFGVIRGLHGINPAVALFQPGAGTETMTYYALVDCNNISFGGTIEKSVVRSNMVAGVGKYFLLNVNTAQSDFGQGDVHLDDNTWMMYGNTIANPDMIVGWVSAESALVYSTFFGVTGNPLYLEGNAQDEWIWRHNSGGALDIGMQFDVNAISFGTVAATPHSNNWFVTYSAPSLRTPNLAGEYADTLYSAAGALDINGLAMSEVSSFKVNTISILLNGGTINDLSNVRIASMPSFGATNVQALWMTGRFRLDGTLALGSEAPAQLLANTNDWSLAPNNAMRSIVLMTSDGAYNVTGIVSSFGFAQDGDVRTIINRSAFTMTFTNEDVLSVAANRLQNANSGPITIAPQGSVTYRYEGSASRWQQLYLTGTYLEEADADLLYLRLDTTNDPLTNNLDGPSFNSVPLTNAGVATNYLDETGAYSVPPVTTGFSGLGIWRYRTAITSNPAAGQLQFDNLTIDSATELYINEVNDDGTNMGTFLALLEVGSLIYIQIEVDATQFVVIEVGTQSVAAGVYTFQITNAEGQGTAPTNNTPVAVVGVRDRPATPGTDLGYVASTRLLTSSTGANVTLPLFTAADAGLTPLSGGGSLNFLRADGTWAVPIDTGGQVDSVVGGTNINVTGTATVPIINLDAAITGVSVNAVTLSAVGVATSYLDETGNYSVPAGAGGAVDSVTGGTNINVTGTAADPIVNLDAAITGVSVNGVTLSAVGAATNYLNEAGAYSVPPDTIVTSLPAGSITAGNLISTVLLFETAVATNSAFKIPFLNTTGNVSGNFGVQFDDGASSFTYNPSTNIFSVGSVAATTVSATLVNGIALTTGGVATNYLDETGAYSVPPSAGITQLTGDVTAGPGSGSQVATIPNDTVTNAKLANMASNTVKVRIATAGDPQDLSVPTNTVVGNFGGAISAQQVQTAQIGPLAVTYAKMQNIAANNVLLGNDNGAINTPQELTGANVNLFLPVFTSTLNGLAPLSGGGSTNFLRADGTWAVPPGGGGGIGGSITDNQVAVGAATANDIEGVATLTYDSTLRFLHVGTSALSGTLDLHDQGRVIFRSNTDADNAFIQYNGDFIIDADVTTLSLRSTSRIDMIVDNGQAIQFEDGVGTGQWIWDNATRLSWDQDLRLDDNNRMNFGNAADAFMSWNGSIMVCDVLSTGNWSFECPLVVRSGNALSIFDATNNDRVTFAVVGTSLQVTEIGMDVVDFVSINVGLSDNDQLRFGNSDDAEMHWNSATSELQMNLLGATDEFEIRINGAQAFRTTGGGATSIGYDGVYPISTLEYFGLGNTSGGQILAHSGHGLNIGFNQIRVFNDNVSDTLEASHCGQMCFKDATTARTLTLASNVDLDFPVSGMTHVVNAFTSGNYTITEGASTTLYYLDGATRIDTAGGCTIGPGGVANIWRESATVYYIWGTGITP